MPTELAPPPTACPRPDDLQKLIRGQLPPGRTADCTTHLDDCSGCQAEVERLAADGDPAFSGAVRHIDKADPPKDSAFWAALGRAEMDLTQAFEQSPAEELKLDFLDPPVSPEYIGRILHFQVRRLIGRGGMGAVFQAYDTNLSREVAVKVLDPSLANNDTARQRFCREARAAASVSHDNLVAVYQVDEVPSGLPFIVMQLVAGETLEQRLRRVGRLSIADAVRIGAQAAAGLASAHANGLIHRDIKPGNILLEAGTEKAKLTDFGLARGIEDIKLTRTGFVAGTPLYMAPEQARGDDADHRADLFSLGSVLYEALAGQPPFAGKTPLAVLRRIADDDHPPLRQINRAVPDWLDDAVDRLLAKNPADRFQTAAEVADLFAQHVACALGAGHEAAGAEPCVLSIAKSKFVNGKRRRPWASIAAVVAALFLLGGLAGAVGMFLFGPRNTVAVPVETVRTVIEKVAAKPGEAIGPDELVLLKSDAAAVRSVSVSKDGTKIASGHDDGSIRLWDVATKSVTRTLTGEGNDGKNGHIGKVWQVHLSPDGSQLVSGGDDGVLYEWDLAKPGKPKRLAFGSSISAVAVDWKSQWVAVGERSGVLGVFLFGEEVPKKQFDHKASISSVAFSGEGPGMMVATAGADKRVCVWTMTGQAKDMPDYVLAGHKRPVYAIASAADGMTLASASADNSVILWNALDGSQLRQLPDVGDGVEAVDFSCCGQVFATAGYDGEAKVWDATTGKAFATFARHKGSVYAVKFSGDGKQLVTGGRDGTIRVWQITK